MPRFEVARIPREPPREHDIKPSLVSQPEHNLNPRASECSQSDRQLIPQGIDSPFAHSSGIMRIIEEQTNLSHHQDQSVQSLTLPKPDVPVFSGEPMEYATFIRAFENMIVEKTTSNSTRLHFLVQYTAGDVHELMRSCFAMAPDEGYVQARALLQNRYGQPYRVASAFVDKLTKGPAIKSEDSNALHKFYILLTSCSNTLQNIGYMSKVENPDNLRAVIARLPFELRRKWRNLVDTICQNGEREIVFQDVVHFVEREARTISHPIFGDLSCAKEHTEKKFSQSSKHKAVYVTQTDPKTRNGDPAKHMLTKSLRTIHIVTLIRRKHVTIIQTV